MIRNYKKSVEYGTSRVEMPCSLHATYYLKRIAVLCFIITSLSQQVDACHRPLLDSLRLETINGKFFIIHQVDPKETLYSISRKYSVPVAQLREHNPTADAGLSVGQLLKVPYSLKPTQKTENENTTHKVAAKETLFSISKLYEVSIEDLKKWNNLTDHSLTIGQELVVQKKNTSDPLVKINPIKTSAGVHTVSEKETLFSISKMYGASVAQLKTWNNLLTDEVKPGQPLYVIRPMIAEGQTEVKPMPIKNFESIAGSDEIREKGNATLLEGTEGNRKYFAHHKTLKQGTILKVRNETTNREVFVKVVGLLAAEETVVIKISKAAFDRLDATGQPLTVELIYYK